MIMSVEYRLEGVPDDLPAGTYATRVKDASIVGNEIQITLEFTGEINPNNPPLFPITKHEDSDPKLWPLKST